MTAVFAGCMFGIYTRPIGFLAEIWPANAIMLGILLRIPASASPLGWLAGALGYLAADLLTGATLFKAVLLNSANLVGIFCAHATLVRLPGNVVMLRHPISVLHLMIGAAVGALGAGLAGAVINPILFGGTAVAGLVFWFATELVNYIATLPFLLTVSLPRRPFAAWSAGGFWTVGKNVLPASALLLSCLAAMLVGGPGAIIFPVPALLWCGLTYSTMLTSLLALLFSLWMLVVIGQGWFSTMVPAVDQTALVSLRLGASLMLLAPIMLASVMQSRNELLHHLHHLVTHDQLTGAISRHTFRERAERFLDRPRSPIALLLLDLDLFKKINDRHGHAAGDEVLIVFVDRAMKGLRPGDLLGRLGGEEFAILLADCPQPEAIRIAERIRELIGVDPVGLGDGRRLSVTVSIGLALVPETARVGLDHVLAEADRALYIAKSKGRDRVESAVIEPPSAAAPA